MDWKTKMHLKISEANKPSHMRFPIASKNSYLASRYKPLLNQASACCICISNTTIATLTDEHKLAIEAGRAKDVEVANELADAIRGSSKNNFITLSGSCAKTTRPTFPLAPKLQRSDHASA